MLIVHACKVLRMMELGFIRYFVKGKCIVCTCAMTSYETSSVLLTQDRMINGASP